MISATETWLFGSHARGDSDDLSDVDVLVAGDGDRPVQLDLVEGKVSTIAFSWAELEHMASYGSLFLHHVRTEGRALGPSRRLSALLAKLPDYQRAATEVACFERVLLDVRRSIERDHSPTFELAVIATTLRHACILGCYLIGQPAFGRRLPFVRYSNEIKQRHADEMIRLYEFRMHLDDRTDRPFDPTTNDVREWLARADDVLATVRTRV